MWSCYTCAVVCRVLGRSRAFQKFIHTPHMDQAFSFLAKCLTKSSPVLEFCAVLLRVAFRGALGTGHTAPSASPQSRVCGSRARSATLQTSSRPTRTATHSVRAARIALLAVFALHSPSSILAPSEMRDRRCDGVWSVRM